jgi:hypothetical protein
MVHRQPTTTPPAAEPSGTSAISAPQGPPTTPTQRTLSSVLLVLAVSQPMTPTTPTSAHPTKPVLQSVAHSAHTPATSTRRSPQSQRLLATTPARPAHTSTHTGMRTTVPRAPTSKRAARRLCYDLPLIRLDFFLLLITHMIPWCNRTEAGA